MRPTAVLLLVGLLILSSAWLALAENIDPYDDGSQYAYGENVGWLNFEPGEGPGVTVSDSNLTGYIWAENIGWLNLWPAVYGGVFNDGNGLLSGYAWSENTGWINFDPIVPGDSNDYGVTIDSNGIFSGWAYGQNIGWIHFQNLSIPYKVQTAWPSTFEFVPVADAGDDQTVEQESYAGTEVILDGSGSTDPDSTPGTNDDINDFDWFEADTFLGSGETINYTFPLGTHTVTLVVTDSYGQTDDDEVTVIVQDTTPPVVNAGSSIIVEQETYEGTTVTLNGSALDNCDAELDYEWSENGVVLGSSATMTHTFNVGTHTLTLKATDDSGNAGTDTVTVTVEDTTPPEITCPADVTVEQESSAGTVVPLEATATDNCDPNPVITNNELAIYPLGVTIVTFTATDASGNSATCSMTVTVVDTTPPVITLNDPAAMTLECGIDSYAELGATVADNLDPAVAVVIGGDTVKTSVCGVYNVTYDATDVAGNAAVQVIREVTVQDTIPPVISITSPPDGTTYYVDEIILADFVVSDSGSGIDTVTAPVPVGSPIDTATAGAKTFTVSAIDNASNSNTVSHSYTVIPRGNIDPYDDDSQYAYGQNVGWLNFEPGEGPGVTVSDSNLTGYIWAENIGWINLWPAVYGGVFNDGNGLLSGYAWSENTGWINFDPTVPGDSNDYGVTIDSNGIFSGWAWGENIGWIHLRSEGPIVYKVQSSWVVPIWDSDGDGIEEPIDTAPTVYSNNFSDAATTYGTITTRGDQILTITDEPDPYGVRLKASPAGGTIPASVSVCGGETILTLNAGDEAVVTCGSVEIKVISGIVEVTFVPVDGPPATTSLAAGNSLTFEAATLTITAPSTNSYVAVLVVEGEEFYLAPGESITFNQTPVAIKSSAIDELEAAKTGDKKIDKQIDKAISHIKKSLDIDPKDPDEPWKKHDLWIDDSHLDPKHGKKVFDEEKKAAKKLMHLMDKKGKKDVPEVVKDACLIAIAKLIKADDILAITVYNEALNAAGNPKVDKELEKCDKEFEKADKELAKEKYDKAIDHYKKAWEHAQKAIKHANK